jgi:hypothetical protein
MSIIDDFAGINARMPKSAKAWIPKRVDKPAPRALVPDHEPPTAPVRPCYPPDDDRHYDRPAASAIAEVLAGIAPPARPFNLEHDHVEQWQRQFKASITRTALHKAFGNRAPRVPR